MHDNNFLPKEINILTLVMTMLAVFSKAFQLWNIKIAAKIKKDIKINLRNILPNLDSLIWFMTDRNFRFDYLLLLA